MTVDSNRQLNEKGWIQNIREAAVDGDIEKFRDLLYTEIGQSRLEGFDLNPENDSDVRAMMRNMRRQIEEGKAFKRGIHSEGRTPTVIEKIAMELGLTPDAAVRGSFAQEGRSGRDRERRGG